MGWLRCPFLLLAGLPCPACGATRALDALVHGDTTGYWLHHPLALPLAVAVVLFPHRSVGGSFFQKSVHVFTAIVLAYNTGFFVFRLLQHLRL